MNERKLNNHYEKNWIEPFSGGPSSIIVITKNNDGVILKKVEDVFRERQINGFNSDKKFNNWYEFAETCLFHFVEMGKVCKYKQMFMFGYITNGVYIDQRELPEGCADSNEYIEKLSVLDFFKLMLITDREGEMQFVAETDPTIQFIMDLQLR